VDLVLACGAALLVCGCVTYLLLGWADQVGLVDRPAGRKNHVHPTPVVGGIGVFVALCVSWIWLQGGEVSSAVLGFCIAGGLLVLVGSIDDVRDLSWRLRFPAQIVAALILCAFGTQLTQLAPLDARPSLELGLLSIPFTVFAVVGLINAVNMVDGIDGLAGSIVAATLLLMAGLAALGGNWGLFSLLLVAATSVLAFLGFNLRLPGRSTALTFLGNSGSALLGLLIAWSAIELTHGDHAPWTPALAPWLVALPILDCLTLIGRRLAGGRSPFSADRMHFHHLLLDRGWSVNQVVLVGLAVHLALAGFGLLLLALGVSDLGLIVGFLLVLAVYSVSLVRGFDVDSGVATVESGSGG